MLFHFYSYTYDNEQYFELTQDNYVLNCGSLQEPIIPELGLLLEDTSIFNLDKGPQTIFEYFADYNHHISPFTLLATFNLDSYDDLIPAIKYHCPELFI